MVAEITIFSLHDTQAVTVSYIPIFVLTLIFFSFREKKQKIEDIKKNIRDAILVSIHFCNILLFI